MIIALVRVADHERARITRPTGRRPVRATCSGNGGALRTEIRDRPSAGKLAVFQLILRNTWQTCLDCSRGWTLWVGLQTRFAPKEAHPRGKNTRHGLGRQRSRALDRRTRRRHLLRNALPVSQWRDRGKVYLDIANGIRSVVK